MATKKTAKKTSTAKVKLPKSAQGPHIDLSLEPEYLAEMDQPRHSWDALWRAHGAATDDDRLRHGILLSSEELVGKGRKIATSHIVTDLLHWAGQIHDFLEKDRGKTNIVGFSEPKFRVIIEDGRKLVDLLTRHGSSSVKSKLAERGDEAKLADATTRLRQRFDEVYAAFEHACASDAAVRERLAATFTKAREPGALSASVLLVVEIAREVFTKPTSSRVLGLVDDGVTPDLIVALERDAKKVAELNARVSGPRVAGGVSQSELDRQDGVCLAHMERLRDVFNAARARHPSVPNLVPRGTRRLLTTHNVRPKKSSSPSAAVAAVDTVTFLAQGAETEGSVS